MSRMEGRKKETKRRNSHEEWEKRERGSGRKTDGERERNKAGKKEGRKKDG